MTKGAGGSRGDKQASFTEGGNGARGGSNTSENSAVVQQNNAQAVPTNTIPGTKKPGAVDSDGVARKTGEEAGQDLASQPTADLERDVDTLASVRADDVSGKTNETEGQFTQRKQAEDGKSGSQHQADFDSKLTRLGKRLSNPAVAIPLLGGLGLAAYFTHLGILKTQNDGASVRVTNIRVESIAGQTGSNQQRKVTITYDSEDATTRGGIPISPDYVKICVNDRVSFDSACKLGSGSRQVKRSENDFFEIIMTDSELTGTGGLPGASQNTPSGGCGSPTPCYSTSSLPYSLDVNGYLTISTTMTNQLAQNIGESLYAAGQIFIAALQAAIPAINATAGAIGGAAKAGFCATMPIFCDSTIWLVILIGVVAMIIFVAVS